MRFGPDLGRPGRADQLGVLGHRSVGHMHMEGGIRSGEAAATATLADEQE